MRDPGQRIADLEEENRRLRITNGVLMDQAENGRIGGESSYGLFQTAVILEDTVRARTEELSEANRRLHLEINRRREVENALLEAKTAAEQANENKTKFLTAVSHDLQQPLTAARLMLQTLAERLGEPSHIDMVDRTNQTLLTMESLLRSLIDISRLEAGITETRIRDFAVAPLLDQLAAEYGLTAQSRRLEFRAVGSGSVIRTDPVLLERVLRNLLTNAVRYTPRGRVLLGLRRAGGGVRIEVWDTGVGIPPDGLTEIFREFRQLPQRATVSEKGLGLGLAIVERICGLLDLETGVDFHEKEIAAGIDDELHRAGVDIIDGPPGGNRRLAHSAAQLGRDERRRRFLDHLLVAALRRALALAQMNDVALAVAKDLKLDVSRLLDVALQQNPIATEGAGRLALAGFQRGWKFCRCIDDAHAFAAAAVRGLDHQRVADAVGLELKSGRVLVLAGVAGHNRHAVAGHQLLGAGLGAHLAH